MLELQQKNNWRHKVKTKKESRKLRLSRHIYKLTAQQTTLPNKENKTLPKILRSGSVPYTSSINVAGSEYLLSLPIFSVSSSVADGTRWRCACETVGAGARPSWPRRTATTSSPKSWTAWRLAGKTSGSSWDRPARALGGPPKTAVSIWLSVSVPWHFIYYHFLSGLFIYYIYGFNGLLLLLLFLLSFLCGCPTYPGSFYVLLSFGVVKFGFFYFTAGLVVILILDVKVIIKYVYWRLKNRIKKIWLSELEKSYLIIFLSWDVKSGIQYDLLF